jgi:hypothetical protein
MESWVDKSANKLNPISLLESLNDKNHGSQSAIMGLTHPTGGNMQDLLDRLTHAQKLTTQLLERL